jgi:hypothetical protein
VRLKWVSPDIESTFYEKLKKVEAAALVDPTVDDALKWCHKCETLNNSNKQDRRVREGVLNFTQVLEMVLSALQMHLSTVEPWLF